MSRARLYLYNNFHAGDVLFTRPLYRELAASGRFDLVLAGFRNNAYLLEDLAAPDVRIHASDYLEQGPKVLYDLRADCPAGYLAVDTWLGAFPDTGTHQWRSVVEVFNRQMQVAGIDYAVAYDADRIPMVDFTPRAIVPTVRGRAIYVDNSAARSGQSDFVFDWNALASRFEDILFVVTGAIHDHASARHSLRNVVDASAYDLRDLSHLSEQCLAILGKGSGPFCCTYTEANRTKPRAVCGYRSEPSPTFWDYPDSPILHLDSMAQVHDFVDSVLSAAGLQGTLVATCD